MRGRRAAEATGALTLAAALVAGIGVAGGLRTGGNPAPVAPASGGALDAEAPATSRVTVKLPAPTVRERKGSIELRGGTGDKAWRYGITHSKEGVCAGYKLTGSGASSESCGPAAQVLGDDLGTAIADCAGAVASTDGRDQEDGLGNYGTMVTGVVDRQAALVRVELLDGRVLELRPVVSKEFGAGLIAGYVPECVIHTWTIVYDAGGKTLSAKAMEDGTRTSAGKLTPIQPMDPKGTIRFAIGLSPERRTGILQAVEVRGAQLTRRDGDRYDFAVRLQTHRESVRAQLEQARKAGDVAAFELSNGTQNLGPDNQP